MSKVEDEGTLERDFPEGYEPLRRLGAGSFGQVFAARRTRNGQEVAVKLLAAPRDDAALLGEVEACARLSHPGIVRALDWGHTPGGRSYVVFELLPGRTLREVLAADGPLEARAAARLMGQVLDALAAAHAAGVVHGDLKPENIMISQTAVLRSAVVLDFGLARCIQRAAGAGDGEFSGTALYAAPELLRGEAASPASDIFAWGAIFVECLCGDSAARTPAAAELTRERLSAALLPGVETVADPLLRRLLRRATEKSRARRAADAAALLRELAELERADGGARALAVDGEGQRKPATTLCCRLVTEGGDAADVEELDGALRAAVDECTAIAARRGGVLVGALGARVIFVFGLPQTREDDAARAARTALELSSFAAARRGAAPALRAALGIHSGLVVIDECLGMGSLGSTAQRADALAQAAEAGEILVSPEVAVALRRDFDFAPGGAADTARRLLAATGGGPRRAEEEEAVELPLIGRDRQLARLRELWATAEAGAATAVLVSGEPGIGKSRLLREVRRIIPGDRWVECRCSPEFEGTPLAPFIDLLGSRAESIEAILDRFGMERARYVPLFAPLLSLPIEEPYRPLSVTPEKHKELTLQALVELIVRLGAEAPCVFVLEDVHWADPTTRELLALLGQALPAARVPLLVVLTSRPNADLSWVQGKIEPLLLARLEPEEVRAMVEASARGGQRVPAELFDRVVARADGVPLFVEELAHMLAGGGPGAALDVPTSLRGILGARLESLSAVARETAHYAAALGREFRRDVLCAVHPDGDAAVARDLDELARRGLVTARPSGREEHCTFRHALLRDSAYEAMLADRRVEVHRRIAATLAGRFPEIAVNRPEVVAQHCEQGREYADAVAHWERASDRAMKRAMYEESQEHVRRGLALLGELPDPTAAGRGEIELLTIRATCQFMRGGYGAPEVAATWSQAQAVAERLGDKIPLKVLNGLWTYHLVRSDLEQTQRMLPLFQRLAERGGDPVVAFEGCAVVGVDHWFRGDLRLARAFLERAIELYHSPEFQAYARDYGYNGGIYCYAYALLCVWYLGDAAGAEALRRGLLSAALEAGDPYSLSIAQIYAATLLIDRGDAEEGLAVAERQLAYAIEQNLVLWQAAATCCKGVALGELGRSAEALPLLLGGMMLYRAIGVESAYLTYLPFLAAAQLELGLLDQARATLEEGLTGCETRHCSVQHPETLRLRGELARRENDTALAETFFEKARAEAARRYKKVDGVRAALSLARLLAAQSRRDEARQILAAVCAGLDPTVSAPAVGEARRLLSELMTNSVEPFDRRGELG